MGFSVIQSHELQLRDKTLYETTIVWWILYYVSMINLLRSSYSGCQHGPIPRVDGGCRPPHSAYSGRPLASPASIAFRKTSTSRR